ncbi:MAG: hypothetical protein R2751_05310 [Bacteroidales bacterium]
MKKKDNIENLLRNLGPALDLDRPREGHETRFLQKLENQPVRRLEIRHLLQIAASLAVLLASAFGIIRWSGPAQPANASNLPESVVQAEAYFSSQMDSRYETIRGFDFENGEEKAVLLEELEDLDAYQQQLMQDLEANPKDERVINAMVRHYQVKLEVMDQIIYHLNQLKTETIKNQNHASS